MGLISDKVLREILQVYASEHRTLPSEEAVIELAVAAGVPEQTVIDKYRTAYRAAGGDDDDPWDLSAR